MPREVELTCPVCQTFKKITVPDAIFDQNNFGTIKIQVPLGAVCSDHQFIAFVDNKGIVRGYERIDLLMNIPLKEEDNLESDGKSGFTLNKVIKKYGLYGVFCLIHAKIFRYPIYIFKNESDFEDLTQLDALFNSYLPKKYLDLTYPIIFTNKEEYDKLKLKKKQKALLIDFHQQVFSTPWNEKLKFEENILKKALEMIDHDEQLFIINQEIHNFINEAEEVKNIIENVKSIYRKELIDTLSEHLNLPRINISRLGLILYFLDQRFSRKYSRKVKKKVEEFLNFL